MGSTLIRAGTLPLILVLAGCAATSHPDFQPVYQKVAVPPQKLSQIEQQFRAEGLSGAAVTTDPLGRVQLSGNYEDERQVEQAFSIARSIVGDGALSRVRPETIGLKDWEISANKAFAAFIQDLARQYGMSVGLEQQGRERQLMVADRLQDGSAQFASGASEPTEQAAGFYRKLAAELARSSAGQPGAKRILVVGHTDDVGDSAGNANLSEKRARAIGRIFEAAHIPAGAIFYQGAGEVFPVGDNRTEEGRARNRRVEIVDLSAERKFNEYLAGRRPNVAHYRPSAPAKASVAQRPAKSRTPDSPKTPEAAKPAEPAPRQGDAPAAIARAREIDLGGRPAQGRFRPVDIGKAPRTGFAFISSAFASELPVGSCAEDRPRISGDVKSLDGSVRHRTLEYMPGTARSSWGTKLNGHFVGFTRVAVLRPGNEPAENPNLLLYRNWAEGSSAAPDVSTTAHVNSYPGDKALLYRAFPLEGPVRCVDLVISKDAPSSAPTSNLIYDRGGVLYQVDYPASIIR